MAFLFERKDSRFWWCGFRDRNNKRVNKSTGIVKTHKSIDKKAAMDVAFQLEEEANESPPMTIGEWSKIWFKRKQTECKPATIEAYENTIEKMMAVWGAGLELNKMTPQDASRFRDRLASTLAESTANTRLKISRSILQAAVDEDHLEKNPFRGMKRIRSNEIKVERKRFSMDQIDKLLSIADPEMQSMIRWGLYTGQRIGDISRLQWDQVDIEKRTVRIRTRKTGKLLVIPLPGHFVDSFSSNREESGPVHPHIFEIVNRSGKTSTISNRFAVLLYKAGLRNEHPRNGKARVPGRRERSEYSFHSLRDTATSLMHEAGIPPATIQALIGHDSERVHATYVKIGEESMRSAANSMPEI